MIVYPSGVDVSSSALRFLSAKLRQHRRELDTRWRRLSPGRQALLTLAHLRNGHPYAQLGAGFGIGTTTASGTSLRPSISWPRSLPPSKRRPGWHRRRHLCCGRHPATHRPHRRGPDRPFYSGKHKKHGMNVQVLADPSGRLLWASSAQQGSVHDVRAAREHGVINALTDASITCWADKGYRGTFRVPYRGRWQTLSQGHRAVNRLHAKIRALVEQAVATLKSWRPLRKLRCWTTRITSLVRATLTCIWPTQDMMEKAHWLDTIFSECWAPPRTCWDPEKPYLAVTGSSATTSGSGGATCGSTSGTITYNFRKNSSNA